MEKLEAVELQSFHDAKWQKNRLTNPADADVPEEVRRAQFAHDTYYPLTVEFCIAKSLETEACVSAPLYASFALHSGGAEEHALRITAGPVGFHRV